MAVNPEDDFQGYMEQLEERQREAERYQEMLDAHEVWRQTTWMGWVVRQLQAIGNHFAPFFEALADTMSSESPNAIIVTLILRVLVIMAYIVSAYALARLVQMLLRKEIVIEEEVIIEISDDEDEPSEGIQRQTAQSTPRRSARQKKKKQ